MAIDFELTDEQRAAEAMVRAGPPGRSREDPYLIGAPLRVLLRHGRTAFARHVLPRSTAGPAGLRQPRARLRGTEYVDTHRLLISLSLFPDRAALFGARHQNTSPDAAGQGEKIPPRSHGAERGSDAAGSQTTRAQGLSLVLNVKGLDRPGRVGDNYRDRVDRRIRRSATQRLSASSLSALQGFSSYTRRRIGHPAGNTGGFAMQDSRSPQRTRRASKVRASRSRCSRSRTGASPWRPAPPLIRACLDPRSLARDRRPSSADVAPSREEMIAEILFS